MIEKDRLVHKLLEKLPNSLWTKIKLNPYLILFAHINSSWIKYLKVLKVN